MIRSSWMRLRSIFLGFFARWLGFRWISVTIGAPLIGVGLSRYYWEDVYVTQGSLYSYASTLSIVFGGIIVLPLILRAMRWDGFRWVAGAFVLLALGIGLSWFFWDELHDEGKSLSATIRNLSLVIGGIIAIELSVWRSIVAERQTAVAQQQAETAQRDLLNQQFQKGAEMLGSGVLSVRLGGIYALRHLAVEHPEQYHVQVMEQLCAFIRGATRTDGQPTAVKEKTKFTREELLSLHPDWKDAPPELVMEEFVARNDIQEAMNAIAFCHDGNLEIEIERDFWLNLRGADLRGADLSIMNLSRTPPKSKISNTVYQQLAIGRYTDMRDAKMDDVNLFMTRLTRVDLSHATGLIQDEVDRARADSDNPPKFEGAKDAQTGKPILWNDATSQDE